MLTENDRMRNDSRSRTPERLRRQRAAARMKRRISCFHRERLRRSPTGTVFFSASFMLFSVPSGQTHRQKTLPMTRMRTIRMMER